MSETATVYAVVEGKTEKFFIQNVLAPYLASKNVFLYAALLSKPGQKGGDVKFVRAKDGIRNFLKQRSDTWVTLLVDYYGLDQDWPGHAEAKKQNGHARKFAVLCQETQQKVAELFPAHDTARRFIPHFSMHEFETLLFSDAEILAEELQVQKAEIDNILTKCGEAEAINDSYDTSPSHRLESLSPDYSKTVDGIAIAEKIGIDTMRRVCPLFDGWVTQLESLAQG